MMRDEKEVSQKLLLLYNRTLQEFREKREKRCHSNCIFNRNGICTNLGRNKSSIYTCADDSTAKKCPVFENKHSDDHESDFNEIVSDPAMCGRIYPKMAILAWVLNGKPLDSVSRWERIKRFFKEIFE